MERRYNRLAQVEGGSEVEETKKKKADRVDRITAKLHALFWVVAAGVILVYSDIISIGLFDKRVNRWCLNAAVTCFVANMCIMLYLTIWLPVIKKVTVPWEIYCPNMIPTSTFLGLVCIVLLIIAFWPVYGLLTPLIVFISLMGFLFSAHFIPWPC